MLDFSGLRMDGVLESTIALYGCKLLCSFVCLPVFKSSISCVSLCCVCLLLFTDLSITMFLVYLWSGAPRATFFHSSSDVIALRFMLFLSDTYEAVLMLTPLLVAVELLIRLLLGGETATLTVDQREATDVDGDTEKSGGGQKGEDKNNATLFKAFGFLGCLMLWLMCGTYAGFSWRQEQAMVRSCLERGSLLSTCLPCLLTALSPVSRQLFWALPAAVLLLAFTAVVNIMVAKLTPNIVNSEMMGGVLQQTTPERTWIPTVSVSHYCVVDSEKSANSCSIHRSYNKQQREADEKPESLSWGPAPPADGWKLTSENVTLVLQTHDIATHSHRSRIWQSVRGSPCWRGELITGLLCVLLVCVFPTVLSTNILLVNNMDTLAVYVMKHLFGPLHAK